VKVQNIPRYIVAENRIKCNTFFINILKISCLILKKRDFLRFFGNILAFSPESLRINAKSSLFVNKKSGKKRQGKNEKRKRISRFYEQVNGRAPKCKKADEGECFRKLQCRVGIFDK